MSHQAKRGDVIGAAGPDGYREWTYERRRPGVPILGILLLALGGILLVNQLAPGTVNLAFSAAGLAFGLGFLYSWFRGGWGFYPGILFVALSFPGLLIGLGALPQRDGYSTMLLGAGLLAVALLRLRDRRGFGWQGLLGLVLAFIGGAAIAGDIGVGAFIWAAVLIGAGIAIIFRR